MKTTRTQEAFQRYRWSIATYRELSNTGLFTDVKTMLIDGEILIRGIPPPEHDTVLTLTFNYLLSVCPTNAHVRNQQAFEIGEWNDPKPDLAIVPGSIRDCTAKTPTTAILVVEVSDTTLQIDLTVKAELYAKASVPEYWVVDLQNRQLVVFRDPRLLPAGLGATAYRLHFTVAEQDSIAPLAAPNNAITVRDLLPRA